MKGHLIKLETPVLNNSQTENQIVKLKKNAFFFRLGKVVLGILKLSTWKIKCFTIETLILFKVRKIDIFV